LGLSGFNNLIRSSYLSPNQPKTKQTKTKAHKKVGKQSNPQHITLQQQNQQQQQLLQQQLLF
jgi:hypothetical protein